MNTTEEIEKLQALRSDGAITKDEYSMLVLKFETPSTNRASENKDLNSYDELRQTNLERIKKHDLESTNQEVRLSSAGENLRASAHAQIWSKVFGFLAFIFFIISVSNLIDNLFNGYSGSSQKPNNIIIFVPILGILSFIFWIRSVMKLSEAGKIMMTHLDGSNFNEKTESEKIDVPFKYEAPEIKSQNKSVKSSFGVSLETNQIEFADGIKGSIIFKQLKNEYCFKDNHRRSITHYYDNFENCVNALHYNEKTGEVLKIGYLGAFS